MHSVAILVESEIRQCIEMDLDAVEVVEKGFTKLIEEQVVIPPIMRVDIAEHKGEVDVKTSYVRGFDSFAIKIASGFFGNYLLGLPSSTGMMVILSAKTGIPEAILLDNGYLTNVRTGAAGAIAAKYLARDSVDTVGVIGAGAQARYQMLALKLVRDFRRLLVYSLIPEEVDIYAREMGPALGVEIEKMGNVEAVVANSDVVVTTTPSSEPYLKARWLHPGLHITAVGSDAEHKQELDIGVVGAADLVVCDKIDQCFRLGECHHGVKAGVISQTDERVAELGELTSGRMPARSSDALITLCDLTGVGVQDTVIALLAFEKAKEKGLGMYIST